MTALGKARGGTGKRVTAQVGDTVLLVATVTSVRKGGVLWADVEGTSGYELSKAKTNVCVYAEDWAIAKVIPKPPEPLKVGDTVKIKFANTFKATIKHIIEDSAWIVYNDGSQGVQKLKDLERV